MKTCKDFGEVLVALGQGKIVKGKQELYRMTDSRLVFKREKWLESCLSLKDKLFSYPAPIHEEPKTVEIDMWVNVYHWGFSHVGFLSRERADREADIPHRIACINIKRTVTEGEGL